MTNWEDPEDGKQCAGSVGRQLAVAPERTQQCHNVLAADDAAASAGNSVAGADLGPVTLATLQEAARAQKEWTKYVAFDEDGRILFSNVKPLDGEVAGFLKLFNKREDTMASGIVLLGEQYDVHRFHPPLVYGRRGDPSVEEGEGIAVCKVQQGGRTLYCLITYVYPTLSARAVPQLKEFCETLCKWGTAVLLVTEYMDN
ncbi:Profilin [Phytophthora cactorum]|nr:Profilin [Phytophthora cactorum]